MKKPVQKSLMTDDQILKVELLTRCRFLPGSFVKRFVRELYASMTEAIQWDGNPQISAKQAVLLDETYWHYREQIKAQVTPYRKPEFIKPTTEAQS